MKKHLLAASFLLSAITSFGAGYQLNLQGLRQLAMGGTGTAWPWDASTIFYNPGGLARLKSIQVYASGLAIMPSTAFGNQLTSGNTGSDVVTRPQTFMPFNIYIGGPVQEDSRIALGLGVYTAAGVGLDWGNDWLGKYIVQSIQLQAVCFQPTIAYRVSDFLSVGAGFVYGIGSMDLRQALPVHGQLGPFFGPNYDEGEAHLHGSASGAGFNAGAQFHLSDKIQLGLTYRSQVNLGIGAGSATFTVPASLRSSFPNTTFDTQLPLPQVASIGIGIRPIEKLTLQFDLNYTGWDSFDSLRINFATSTSSLKNEHEPRHYRNTLTPRIGAAYKLGRVVSLMIGGAFDPTPVTNGFVSPDLPDADRAVVTGGVAIKPMPRFTILTAFEGTTSVKRNATYNYADFNGVYKTEAATVGVGIYYNF
jgi:long-chain fatty acid transport protein